MAIFKKIHKRTGVEYFYIRFQLADGRRKKEKAGTNYKQAAERLKVVCGQVAAGTYVDEREAAIAERAAKEAAAEAAAVAAVRFADLKDLFLAGYRYKRRSSGHHGGHYRERLGVLVAYFGDRPVEQLAIQDFDNFATAREQGTVKGYRPAGPSTIKKDLTAAGTVLKWAKKYGHIRVNPADVGLNKPSEPEAGRRALTIEEYGRIRDACPPRLALRVRLAVVTAQDLGDVSRLKWDDVDRERGVLHFTRSKTGVKGQIPIGTVAAEVLEAAGTRFRGGYVFVDSEGKPYTSTRELNQDSKDFVALLVQLGIRRRGEGRSLEDGPSFKNLRTTAATWASRSGASDDVVAALLLHSRNRSMSARYLDLLADDLRGIIAALDAAERGMAPQMAPQVDLGVAAAASESANLKPLAAFQKIGT